MDEVGLLEASRESRSKSWSQMWIIEPCRNADRDLWVDWVA
jgi:hypothetical protein